MRRKSQARSGMGRKLNLRCGLANFARGTSSQVPRVKFGSWPDCQAQPPNLKCQWPNLMCGLQSTLGRLRMRFQVWPLTSSKSSDSAANILLVFPIWPALPGRNYSWLPKFQTFSQIWDLAMFWRFLVFLKFTHISRFQHGQPKFYHLNLARDFDLFNMVPGFPHLPAESYYSATI